MSFLYPLGFLGLIAIPIVILIYLLRSRYKTKTVSSTFIWKRSLKYVKRRIPLNFIMSMILILQILVVVVASFAIARPTVNPLKTEEKIVILDASASMLAVDGDSTRFDAAKKKIEESAEEIGDNHKMTLILAGEEPIMVKSRTADKGEFLTALRPLECTMKGSNVNKALEMAKDILNQNKGAQVLLYTDKSYIDTDGIEVVDCKRAEEWNAGIISFDVDDLKSGSEFVVNVGGYGKSTEFNVELYINGKFAAEKSVSLTAGQIRQLRFSNNIEDNGQDEIKVRLDRPVTSYKNASVKLSVDDSFTYDNEMTVYPKEKKTPKILYVSKYVTGTGGKKSADRSLLNFALRANGYSIKSEDMYSSVNEAADITGYDIYIYEGLVPYTLPTDGAVWLIDVDGAFTDETGIVIGDRVNVDEENGYIIDKSVGATTEIVKNVHIDIPLHYAGKDVPAAVSVYRPIYVQDAPSFKSIYEANTHSIFVAGNYRSAPMIVTSFDFADSSVVAYISDFPMLIKNMIGYSVPELMPARTATIGSQIEIKFPVGAKYISRYYVGENGESKLENRIDVEKFIAELEEKAKEDSSFNVDANLKDVFTIVNPGKYEIVVEYPDGEDADLLNDEKRYSITGHLATEETIITENVPTEYLKYPMIADNAKVEYAQVEIFPYVIALLILLLIIEWGVYYREQY